jgi:transposase
MVIDVMSLDALGRVLTGLFEYTVLHAFESGGELIVEVIAMRAEAACPGCGEFSTHVKTVRAQIVRDVALAGRPVRLTVQKRAFRCVAPGCLRRSFTQHTDELPARKRVTTRCRKLMGRAGKDRSTAAVAREYKVSWATAWNAVVEVATRELAARPRCIPPVFGVDETRFWSKQPWVTGTVDLATSELLAMFTRKDRDHRYTNGRTEGTNRTIKHVKRFGSATATPTATPSNAATTHSA